MGGPCFLVEDSQSARKKKVTGPPATDNFAVAPFTLDGAQWHSVEQCYQAYKFLDPKARETIRAMAPFAGESDSSHGMRVWRAGAQGKLRSDWEARQGADEHQYMYLVADSLKWTLVIDVDDLKRKRLLGSCRCPHRTTNTRLERSSRGSLCAGTHRRTLGSDAPCPSSSMYDYEVGVDEKNQPGVPFIHDTVTMRPGEVL